MTTSETSKKINSAERRADVRIRVTAGTKSLLCVNASMHPISNMMKDKIIAVAGVNDNPEKFGHRIFFGLCEAGYNVFPVGVRGGEVKGVKIFKTLAELSQKQKPDLVITVVPPAGTDKIVDDCINLGIKEIWMQPGSQSPEGIKKAEAAGIKVTQRGCFMVFEGVW
ncbi:MAG: CoA-binding protein [Endomicrobia bacterium]|nr:CoA-binding protein [Endomicrobiia bacterium]